jgi:hypothetical protein
MGFIDRDALMQCAGEFGENDYGRYLRDVVNEDPAPVRL